MPIINVLNVVISFALAEDQSYIFSSHELNGGALTFFFGFVKVVAIVIFAVVFIVYIFVVITIVYFVIGAVVIVCVIIFVVLFNDFIIRNLKLNT